MSDQNSYEGQTVRLPGQSLPAQPAAAGPAESWVEPMPRRPHDNVRRRQLGGLLVLGGAALLLSSIFGNIRLPFNAGFVEGTVQAVHTFDARNIVVDVGSGNVEVQPGSGSEVVVEITRHGFGTNEAAGERAAEELPLARLEHQGDTVRVEERADRRDFDVAGRSPYSAYRITIPAEGTVEVNTGSGNVLVEGITGGANLETGSGEVKVIDIAGPLEARAGSGNILVEESTLDGPSLSTGSGDIRIEEGSLTDPKLRTSSGNIVIGDVSEVSGAINARTGSGNIEIRDASDATLDLEAGSGNIVFDGSLSQSGPHAVRSGSGNITLDLPDDTNAMLHAEAGSGHITSDWPLTGDDDSEAREGELGDGGAVLNLRTPSGNIEVERD